MAEVAEVKALAAASTMTAAGPDEALVARGRYLARAGNCQACHTAPGGSPWAGGRGIETPFGVVYAGNLTPDPAGLSGWTSSDFWRALHHGRSRDGRMLYPAFPYTHFTRVTRTDADALWAFMQSLPPVAQANRPHELRWPVSTQWALGVWRALYFRPAVQRADTNQDAAWNRGAYLVQGLGHCSACHSARNALGASEVLDLSGGMIPMQAWYAPSLAAPNEASLADWPLAEITQLLATGTSPRASTLGPMAEVVLHSTQHLSPNDLAAMAVFLKSVPPTAPTVARDTSMERLPVKVGAALRGEKLYGDHCAACHGAQGEGVAGAYPPLAGNRAVTLPVTANLVQVVIHGGFGPATAGRPRPFGMPPFAMVMSDADVAAVLTYLRQAWGNQAGAVSELDVAQQRSLAR
jgi:mono/diheme cytochrome c family protein